jgi:hypothetical protein
MPKIRERKKEYNPEPTIGFFSAYYLSSFLQSLSVSNSSIKIKNESLEEVK